MRENIAIFFYSGLCSKYCVGYQTVLILSRCWWTEKKEMPFADHFPPMWVIAWKEEWTQNIAILFSMLVNGKLDDLNPCVLSVAKAPLIIKKKRALSRQNCHV
jgi:hypothetical protein